MESAGLEAEGPDTRVLDMEVFEELVATLGNDTNRVSSVYRKFVDTAALRLDEARHQPPATNAAVFHALKGSAGMVGANRLSALAGRFQDVALGFTDETKHAALGEIEGELAKFRLALGVALGGLPADR